MPETADFSDIPWPVSEISAADLPPAMHSLLVHDQSITARLEAVWAEPAALRVLSLQHEGDTYCRTILLLGKFTGQVMEWATISLDLRALPGGIREGVLEGKTSFGTLMHRARIPFHNRPEQFLRLTAPALLAQDMDIAEGQVLYGRRTRLWDSQEKLLGTVTEIFAQPG